MRFCFICAETNVGAEWLANLLCILVVSNSFLGSQALTVVGFS
jgi:hypothetical protein